MLVTTLLTIFLGILTYEDFKERKISTLWLLLLFFVSIWKGYRQLPFTELLTYSSINTLFVLFQCILISIYVSIKEKKWTNPTIHYLGWGDILFFIALTPFFHPINFVVFYTGGLLTVLLGYILLKGYLKESLSSQIPLAGGIAAVFICLLIINIYLQFNFYRIDWFHHFV